MSASRHGLLLVDKPAGPTSHDVVEAARRALKERRIGHTGTLDPAATGLLVLCVGRATRLQHYLLSWPKTYSGDIRLGWATTTYDVEGEPVGEPAAVPPLDEGTLAALAARFRGEVDQLPPPYSAKKTGGKKFYELARAGEEVPLQPKRVTIHEVTLQRRDAEHIAFEVTCSSGTYLRSLAHDIGQTLGCGGHLATLRRLRIGPWQVSRAVAAEVLANRPRDIPEEAFVPLADVALPFPTVVLNPVAASHFRHGQDVVVREAEGDFVSGKEVVVRDRDGGLVGIGVALAYLPRARTLNLAPRAVLGAHLEAGSNP
ncbi:MAG: tRNA pseudouridine(55) synthase TruB [Acidobacteriota bacterium]|jgi:tRNA pseudouridine55 synthase